MQSLFKILDGLDLPLLVQYKKQLVLYKHRYKSRKALLKLDETRLRDIGISKQQAQEEGFKPFWIGSSVDLTQQTKRARNELEVKVISH